MLNDPCLSVMQCQCAVGCGGGEPGDACDEMRAPLRLSTHYEVCVAIIVSVFGLAYAMRYGFGMAYGECVGAPRRCDVSVTTYVKLPRVTPLGSKDPKLSRKPVLPRPELKSVLREVYIQLVVER